MRCDDQLEGKLNNIINPAIQITPKSDFGFRILNVRKNISQESPNFERIF